MGDVVRLTAGRVKPAKRLPKPVDCEECGDPIETARLQALTGDYIMKPKRCFSCQTAFEARRKRELAAARDDDIVIIRGR